MKFYVKPSVDVVELSVKETIADLPKAVADDVIVDGKKIHLTTYNLAAVPTSENA